MTSAGSFFLFRNKKILVQKHKKGKLADDDDITFFFVYFVYCKKESNMDGLSMPLPNKKKHSELSVITLR